MNCGFIPTPEPELWQVSKNVNKSANRANRGRSILQKLVCDEMAIEEMGLTRPNPSARQIPVSVSARGVKKRTSGPVSNYARGCQLVRPAIESGSWGSAPPSARGSKGSSSCLGS
jgi:hypothetical protein